MTRGIRTSLRIVLPIVCWCAIATTIRAQGGPPAQGTPVRGRPDKIQRELERQYEKEMLEQKLMEGASRHVRRYPPLVLDQIRDDFLQIQVIDRNLMRATAGDTLDLKLVANSAGEIRKRSRRLKENLALPRPETPSPGRSAIPGEPTEVRLRISLSDLSDLIDKFVGNPVFEQIKLVDAKLSAKARQDIEAIIELSSQIKRSSQKLKAAEKAK